MTGMAYVLSMDLMYYLIENRPYLNLYPHDDCALGIWLLPISGKTVVDKTGLFNYKGNKCTEDLEAHHPVNASRMVELFENHQKHIDYFCPDEGHF